MASNQSQKGNKKTSEQDLSRTNQSSRQGSTGGQQGTKKPTSERK